LSAWEERAAPGLNPRPIPTRRQRYRERLADFSQRNIRDAVTLGNRGYGLGPDFLVDLGAAVVRGDVGQYPLRLGS